MVLVINEGFNDAGHEDPGHPERPIAWVAARSPPSTTYISAMILVVVGPIRATRDELVPFM